MINVKSMEQLLPNNNNIQPPREANNTRPTTSNGVSGNISGNISGNNNNTAGLVERKTRAQEKLNCPRCNSTNTKFCYYNNYSLTQPRYFCKGCRRYWTEGGSLRNVPVGGSSRKNKRSSSSSSYSSIQSSTTPIPDLNPPPILFTSSSNQIPKNSKGSSQDLNLMSFPLIQQDHHHHHHHTMSQFLQMPKMESNINNITSQSSSSSTSTSSLVSSSALELLRTGLNVNNTFMAPNNNTPMMDYASSRFPTMVDYKTSNLSFYNNMNRETNEADHQSRVLFPFGDQMKELSSTITHEIDHHHHDDSQQHKNNESANNGYWSGMFSSTGGGSSW